MEHQFQHGLVGPIGLFLCHVSYLQAKSSNIIFFCSAMKIAVDLLSTFKLVFFLNEKQKKINPIRFNFLFCG